MTNPFSRTNFLSPDQWRARAQAIQDRIKDWSLDELLRGKRAGEEPHHLGSEGGDGRGYDTNQPRVPAGHPDGGQWTKLGHHHARAVAPNTAQHARPGFFGRMEHEDVHSERTFSRINYVPLTDESVAQPSVEVLRIDGVVGTNLPWRQYAELGRISAQDEREVEETTEILSKLLFKINSTTSRVRGLTAQQYGTLVHTEFAIAVKALKLPRHLRHLTLEVEQSFDKSGATRYGQPGSIRTDVLLRNAQGTVIAIYDVKTGDAEMRPSTEQKYRDYTKVHPSVRLFILRAKRGQR